MNTWLEQNYLETFVEFS